MSTIAIIGGHGKVALLLAHLLDKQGHVVRSTIRNEAHGADVERTGAIPVLLDIEGGDAGDFADLIGAVDAIVFSAGAGGDGRVDRKLAVDLGGSLKSIEAARLLGARRFVQVSAMGVDERVADDAADVWRAYVEAKRDADAALRESGLDWTIVRPGTLTDDPPAGRVAIAERLPRGEVPRADVAAVLATVLADDSTIGAQFDLTQGEQSIPDALATLR